MKPFDLHLLRLLAVTGLTSIVALLLPMVFLVQFQMPKRGRVVGLLALAVGALGAPVLHTMLFRRT